MADQVLKRFEFGAVVTKAWIEKSGDKERHLVKAIASDTGVDLHGERFTEKALSGMQNCIKNNTPAPVILLPTHWDTFEIGKAVDAQIVDSPTHGELKALEVTIELDIEYPQAKSLYKEVEGGAPQKQLSVGGYLNPDAEKPYFWEEKEYEAPDGNVLYDYVLALDDLILDHIAVTRKDHAANPRTSFSAIGKSLGIEKPEKPQKINKEAEVMSKADKQAQGILAAVSKGIQDFFKSQDADSQKVEHAKEQLAKTKEALEAFGEGEELPADVVEALKSLGFSKSESSEQTPAAEETPAEGANEENPAGEEPAATFDAETFKSELKDDLLKSVKDEMKNEMNSLFGELGKSLGSVIGEAVKAAVAPVNDKIKSIETTVAGSKGLNGQETAAPVNKSKETQEDDGLWSGIIKGAIPEHVFLERKYNSETEE